jgi:cell division protein FtsB
MEHPHLLDTRRFAFGTLLLVLLFLIKDLVRDYIKDQREAAVEAQNALQSVAESMFLYEELSRLVTSSSPPQAAPDSAARDNAYLSQYISGTGLVLLDRASELDRISKDLTLSDQDKKEWDDAYKIVFSLAGEAKSIGESKATPEEKTKQIEHFMSRVNIAQFFYAQVALRKLMDAAIKQKERTSLYYDLCLVVILILYLIAAWMSFYSKVKKAEPTIPMPPG